MNEESTKCSTCDEEIVKGYLSAGNVIKWIKEDDHFLKKLLVIGERVGENLSVKGQYCRKCKRIILDNIEIE